MSGKSVNFEDKKKQETKNEFQRNFESNKTISFKINDNKLLREYTQIQQKDKILLNIEFESEPTHGNKDKYIPSQKISKILPLHSGMIMVLSNK